MIRSHFRPEWAFEQYAYDVLISVGHYVLLAHALAQPLIGSVQFLLQPLTSGNGSFIHASSCSTVTEGRIRAPVSKNITKLQYSDGTALPEMCGCSWRASALNKGLSQTLSRPHNRREPALFSGSIYLRETQTGRQQPVLLPHRPRAREPKTLAQPQHGFEPSDRPSCRVEGLKAADPRHVHRGPHRRAL